MMSLKVPLRPRKSRNHVPEPPKTVVEPTPSTQIIYNQIREDEVRHQEQQKQNCLEQHVAAQDRLHLPNHGAPSVARSITNDSNISGSLSPGSTADMPDRISIPVIEVSGSGVKRPRGRRGGPLPTEKRYKTAIKRRLGLVCSHCRTKRIVVGGLSRHNTCHVTDMKTC